MSQNSTPHNPDELAALTRGILAHEKLDPASKKRLEDLILELHRRASDTAKYPPMLTLAEARASREACDIKHIQDYRVTEAIPTDDPKGYYIVPCNDEIGQWSVSGLGWLYPEFGTNTAYSLHFDMFEIVQPTWIDADSLEQTGFSLLSIPANPRARIIPGKARCKNVNIQTLIEQELYKK